MRRGFSLIEVVISLTVLAAAIAMVAQVFQSTRKLEGLQAAEDDVATDADRVSREVISDLAQSGWHSANFSMTVVAAALVPSDWVADRGVSSSGASPDRYWPYVLAQHRGASSLGVPTASDGYPFAIRASSMVELNLPASILPGVPTDATKTFNTDRAGYLASFYARSQELIFLKQITNQKQVTSASNITPRGNDEVFETFKRKKTVGGVETDFDWNDLSESNRRDLGVLFASPFHQTAPGNFVVRDFDVDGNGTVNAGEGDANADRRPDGPYGNPMYSAVLDPAGGQFRFRTAWQTNSAPQYNPAVVENQELREYMYAVLPGRAGFGRLVRAYKAPVSALPLPVITGIEPGQVISADAVYAMVVEKVLSDHCVRIVADTARTDPNLDISEIRLRLYFARRSTVDPETVVHQIIDVVAALRSRNTQVDRNDDRRKFTPPDATGTGVSIPGFRY